MTASVSESASARLRTRQAATANDSDHPNPFQQSDDIFSIPEEPVTEETFEAYREEVEEREDSNVAVVADKRPWYRRPSAWWCVAFMTLLIVMARKS